jgi:hypothetical protein
MIEIIHFSLTGYHIYTLLTPGLDVFPLAGLEPAGLPLAFFASDFTGACTGVYHQWHANQSRHWCISPVA